MYVRALDHNHPIELGTPALNIPKGTIIGFDTYFNALSVRPWQSKCQINDLHLTINGSGEIEISVYHECDTATRQLSRQTLDISNGVAVLDLADWESLNDGIVFPVIKAISDVSITSMSYATKTPAPNRVQLGIVVTHFKRKAYVLPAIERISKELLTDSDIRDSVELIVVDNSSDIEPSESGKATVLPNRNLGGSGGFTRGLLHVKDNGFSHCLFMDDDASCEIDSIYRTYRLLQYAKEDRLAVTGAMIMDHNLYESHEIGAYFRKGVGRPLGKGFDLRRADHVQTAANSTEKIDYGAWWHFAFKIDTVKCFPFPSFVKGDDQLFSISNDFDIIHLNGVAVWAESFSTKYSPVSKYLGTRAELVIFAWYRIGRYRTAKKFYKTLRESLFSFDYPGASARILACEDFMKGPRFWVNNMDMTSVFPKVAKISASTQLKPIENAEISKADSVDYLIKSNTARETYIRKTLRKITLNGHILPSKMLSSSARVRYNHYHTHPRHVFLRQKTIQILKEPNLGFILNMNRREFFVLYFKAIFLSVKLAFLWPKLCKAYANAMPKIMTEEFWRGVYNLPKNPEH